MSLVSKIRIKEIKKELKEKGRYFCENFSDRFCEEIVKALKKEGVGIGKNKPYNSKVYHLGFGGTGYILKIQENENRG